MKPPPRKQRQRTPIVCHAEDADGANALSDERPAEGGGRDGVLRLAYNLTARDEHVGITALGHDPA